MRRFVGAMVVALLICGYVMAEDFTGNVTKIEDGSITVKQFAFGKDKKSEEKTFKISKDVKVVRTGGKDKEDVKLTLDELKTAVKVTAVRVTVTHDGDNATEIKITPFGGGGRPKKDKKDDK